MREDIEECSGPEELRRLQLDVKQRFKECCRELDIALQTDSAQQIKHLVARLNFLGKVLTEIHEKL